MYRQHGFQDIDLLLETLVKDDTMTFFPEFNLFVVSSSSFPCISGMGSSRGVMPAVSWPLAHSAAVTSKLKSISERFRVFQMNSAAASGAKENCWSRSQRFEQEAAAFLALLPTIAIATFRVGTSIDTGTAMTAAVFGTFRFSRATGQPILCANDMMDCFHAEYRSTASDSFLPDGAAREIFRGYGSDLPGDTFQIEKSVRASPSNLLPSSP